MQRRVALNTNSLNKCSWNHYSKCKDLALVHINIPDSIMKNAFYKDKWNCEIVQAQFDCTIFLNSLQCIFFNLMEAYRLHFNVNVSEFSHVKRLNNIWYALNCQPFHSLVCILSLQLLNLSKQFTINSSYGYINAVVKRCMNIFTCYCTITFESIIHMSMSRAQTRETKYVFRLGWMLLKNMSSI